LVVFSHFWFATPQLVLQALWQEVWHSPHPPVLALSQRSLVSSVLILFIFMSPYIHEKYSLNYQMNIITNVSFKQELFLIPAEPGSK
jgi:hypothetical protein